jgi:UDP-glucose 4-epimerase
MGCSRLHPRDRLAKAPVLALKALEQGLTHRAFDLRNGFGYSVREVIALAERVTGHRVPMILWEKRPGDPARLIGNSTRAADELHWKPQFTNLDEIISTAWAWHERRAQEKSRT